MWIIGLKIEIDKCRHFQLCVNMDPRRVYMRNYVSESEFQKLVVRVSLFLLSPFSLSQHVFFSPLAENAVQHVSIRICLFNSPVHFTFHTRACKVNRFRKFPNCHTKKKKLACWTICTWCTICKLKFLIVQTQRKM